MSGKVEMVTMRDVAQASGFSPATVSIVLNNAPLARYIAPATKKRIEDAARKLGYRPNAMARSEEHTSELQSRLHLVCRLLLEKKKNRPTRQSRNRQTSRTSQQSVSASWDVL